MKKSLLLIIMLFISFFAFTADLTILQRDILAFRGNENGIDAQGDGVHLYIRQKDGVQSVLLCETTKDPEGNADNYAYRAPAYNSINGDEIRMLDGKVLDSQYAKNSLVSSTIENHPDLGPCFHIYVPSVIIYGYPWSRSGEVKISKGTFVNIRTFTAKYADYTGEFKDNPFMFDFAAITKEDVVEETKVVMTDEYNPLAAQKFQELADMGKGFITYAKGAESLPDDLYKLLEEIEDKRKVDVVFAIDTTGSMKDDMEMLIKEWIPRLVEQVKEFEDIRFGLILYRDYNDDYLFKTLPVKFYDFTDSVDSVLSILRSVRIRGNEGGDEPEAVYEALYASEKYYNWREDAFKKIILIGDAQPHERPRGRLKVTQEMVVQQAQDLGIQLDCIIIPDQKKR